MADKTAIFTLSQSAANLLKLKRYSEALPVLQSILILDPNNEEALYGIGITFAQLKRYPEAINAYNRALKINQNNSDLWNYKGVALFELGKYSEAIDSFTQALGISPNDANIEKNKEFAFKKLIEQNEQNCLKKSNESLALDWNDKGTVYFKQGKYNDAINAFDQALKITPNNGNIKNNKIEAQKKFEKSKIKPVSSIVGVIIAIAIMVFIGAIIVGFVGGLINHQTNQPLQISTPQPTTTKSIGQLLQEAETKRANSISQAITGIQQHEILH